MFLRTSFSLKRHARGRIVLLPLKMAISAALLLGGCASSGLVAPVNEFGRLTHEVTSDQIGSLKVERHHGMRFNTRRLAKDEEIDWITYYNHRRLHSTLGYASPMAFEQKWLASQIRGGSANLDSALSGVSA